MFRPRPRLFRSSGQYSISSFQYDSLESLQVDIIKDEFDTSGPGLNPESGGKLYIVELHEEFEMVVTVAFTRVHSLQTPIVGVIGHVQLLVGQFGPGNVVLVSRKPFVINVSIRKTLFSSPA